MSTLKGPAYNVVEKLTYKQSHKIDVSIQRLYGAQIDQEIPLMERGLREACFWNPNGQNFAVEFTERDIQCKLQDRSNMAHYFMGIEAMRAAGNKPRGARIFPEGYGAMTLAGDAVREFRIYVRVGRF